MNTVEIVLFRLKEGVSAEQFIAAAKPTFDILPTFEGYIDRELTVTQDGTWIDIVHWRDIAAALQAAEVFMANPLAQTFGELIDEKTMVMHHAQPQITSMPVGA
jgi:hypothetical protein